MVIQAVSVSPAESSAGRPDSNQSLITLCGEGDRCGQTVQTAPGKQVGGTEMLSLHIDACWGLVVAQFSFNQFAKVWTELLHDERGCRFSTFR